MNKKILIIGIIIVLVIGIIIGVVYLTNKTSNIENEVIEIVDNLNNCNGYCGDWNKNLHIMKINEVKKIDIDLLSEEEKDGLDNEDSNVFMIDLQEKTYGNVQIVVVNGEVTANSLTGETYEEMWNSDIFINDKINVDKINKAIK